MSDFYEKLLEEKGALVMLLGAAFAALGIIGEFKDWFGAIGAPYRLTAIGVGVFLLIVGLIIIVYDRLNKPFQILNPRPNESVPMVVDISGTSRRSLPKNKELWLLRIYPDENRFVPSPNHFGNSSADWVGRYKTFALAATVISILGRALFVIPIQVQFPYLAVVLVDDA